MSDRHPKLLLEDILDSAEKIFRYTESLTYEEFITDSKTIDAVIRNFEIIGEASNRLPRNLKTKTTLLTGLESGGSEIVLFTNISV
jgi:uncharacterized protein with HEPN domain